MASVFVAIGIILIIYVGYRLYRHLFPLPDINPNAKYVLITGCDTGLGHALAVELDKQGFYVLAGLFHPDNEERVTGQLSTRATVFPLDITQKDEVNSTYEMVKEKTNTLHALVNNAGIYQTGLIDWTPVDDMRKIMDVNFFGHVAMIKKFLPLLISRRGSRVVNICSVVGYLAESDVAAYSASKFALEAFSDSLRREMYSWGLKVSIIEPGYTRTPLIEGLENSLRSLWKDLDDDTQKRWGEGFFQSTITKTLKNPRILNAENPQKVVKALRHAVMNSAPQIRYRPGWQSSLFCFPLSIIPAWIADFILIKMNSTSIQPAGLVNQLD